MGVHDPLPSSLETGSLGVRQLKRLCAKATRARTGAPSLGSPRELELWATRLSARIHKAVAQLWGTSDLWLTVDRAGFNPPECEGWSFPGPRLHWDLDLVPPLRFSTQGILYLTDTAAEQGPSPACRASTARSRPGSRACRRAPTRSFRISRPSGRWASRPARAI
jgi:hypothetical protein